MKNDFTFLTYICSSDRDKLTQFIWNLQFKIEVKEITFAEKKWFVWFNYADHRDPKKTLLKNLNLDEL